MSFHIYDAALLTFVYHTSRFLLYLISTYLLSTYLHIYIYIPCGGALDVAALVAAVSATLPQLHQVGLLCNISWQLAIYNLHTKWSQVTSYSGPAVGFMVLFIALNLLNCSNVTSNMDQTLELAWVCMDSEYIMLSSCNKRVRDNFPQIW